MSEELTEERLEELRRERFAARVAKVREVMQEQRVDFRGLPLITADGRIAVQIIPVEMQRPPTNT